MKKKSLSREQLNQMDREQLIEKVLESQEQNDVLQEELNKTTALLFGRRTEKRETVTEDQIRFEFNEIEAAAPAEVPEEEVTVREHVRRKKAAGKKEEDLSKLPKEIVVHSIPEEELRVLFPEGWKRLPDEVYSNVEYEPAKYIVKEHHIEVYSGKKEDRIIRANHPAELLQSSIATPSLVAGIMNGKYVNALPLYRMEQEFRRSNVPVSRQTMAGWVIRTTERYLSLICDRLKEELLSHSVLHADETPVQVTKDGRPAGSKSYMWVYRSSALDDRPVVIYDYRKTRKTDHPKEFLQEFRGTLVTDGYEVYHKLARDRSGEIQVAGCWVHLKRKYSDAIKAMGKSGSGTAAGTLAGKGEELIRGIFHADNLLNELSPEERLRERARSVRPLVDAFYSWVREHRGEVTKQSATGKAFSYTLEQESYLRVFTETGDVPMDNNAAERAIRPFVIGKKNWVMCDTINGAKDSAIVYSLTETAKANHLIPYEYLKHLLTEIPKHMADTDAAFLEELLPWSKTLPDCCRES